MFDCLKRLFRPRARKASGEFVGRRRTRDISFLAQSPVGFIGRVTRSVPAPKIFPYVNDTQNPVASFGLAVLATTNNTVRGVQASDTEITNIFGIGVQPFPFQVSSGTNFGAQALSTLVSVPPGLMDVLKSGPMIVYCNSAQAPSATLGSAAFVWIAASTGTHIQGGFETAAVSGSTIALPPGVYFNGPGDSTGAIELAFNL
jgi:hypothetical protein